MHIAVLGEMRGRIQAAIHAVGHSDGNGRRNGDGKLGVVAKNSDHHDASMVPDLAAWLAARLNRNGHAARPALDLALLLPETSARELGPESLRRALAPADFESVLPTDGFPKAGQDRLLSALGVAAGVKNPGFNLFVTQYGGGGEAVMQLLREFPPQEQQPHDFVYVRNFRDLNQPSLIVFQPGEAKPFGEMMEKTLQALLDDLPSIGGSAGFISRQVRLEEDLVHEGEEKLAVLEKEIGDEGFGLQRVRTDDGSTGYRIGVRVLMSTDEDDSEETTDSKDSNSASKKKTTGLMMKLIPMQEVETACAQYEAKGDKPVFVRAGTNVGPAFSLMTEKQYTENFEEPALNKGDSPLKHYSLDAMRDQFREFQLKVREMSEASKVARDKANKELISILRVNTGEHIDRVFEPIRKKYPDPCVGQYLDGIRETILGNLPLFTTRDEALSDSGRDSSNGSGKRFVKGRLADSFKPNVLVCSTCNATNDPFPIVYEKNPTPEKLLGAIHEPAIVFSDSDLPLDRHQNIRGGSLLQAQGGYLIVDLLSSARYGSLAGLLRAVETEQLQIAPTRLSSNSPQPIPLNVKVVILDPNGYYDELVEADRTFEEHFVRAPYDPMPKALAENMQGFAGSLLAAAQAERFLPVTPRAMAGVMEEGMEQVENQDRFLADFDHAMDLIREANAVARDQGASELDASHVNAALQARKFRHGMREDRLHEAFLKHILHIATSGAVVGQINGLVISGNSEDQGTLVKKPLYDVLTAANGGDWVRANKTALSKAAAGASGKSAGVQGAAYQFGLPARITATVSNAPGAGVVPNDEHSGYLGPSTVKAFQNLESYLMEKFGADGNMGHFLGRISFEQNYGGIDGDSATQAQTIALLSALSGVPIKQGVAITGSMDVHGYVQAIGGVNLKIAGFYDTCKEQGLDGTQGCVIPADNAKDLMLRADIIEAVRKGEFHIWPVKTIDEAVEIMTGKKAGIPDAEGHYPAQTVYGRVQRTLENYRLRYAAQQAGLDNHNGWNLALPFNGHNSQK